MTCIKASFWTWIIFAFATLHYNEDFVVAQVNPDAHLSTPQIITKYDYPVESHYVTTADGYILNVFRIPTGKDNAPSTMGPVYVQHGLLCSSDDWLLQPPENNLPFLLADQGYDVWLGNARGNDYSMNHTTLSPSNISFWKFSWHEMGKFDLPAVIDYILNTTQTPQLKYVGHSMGTTMFFVCMTLNPSYNSKVTAFFGLAPVAYLGCVQSPVVRATALLVNQIQALYAALQEGQFIPSILLNYINQYAPIFCQNILAKTACDYIIFLFGGYDPSQITPSVTSNIVGHTPSSSSVLAVLHYSQLTNHPGVFRQFDWGLKNMVVYGQMSPPSYNLSVIQVPLYLYWGDGDLLADPSDVALLNANLPASWVKAFTRVNWPSFQHLDFTYGTNSSTLVYKPIINIMNGL